MVYDVPADAVEFVRNENVEVVSVPRWYQHHLTFNAHDQRFKSKLVRKALNLAVDRVAIINKVLHGAGSPSSGPIYPGFWSFDSNAPVYPFDPEQAAALLESAGYPLRPDSPRSSCAAALHLFVAQGLRGLGTNCARSPAGSAQRRSRHAVQGRAAE